MAQVFDPNRHDRQSTRLRGHDYARDAYYVTICTRNRVCLLGNVVDGELRLNDAGNVAQETWVALPDHFPRVALDTFIVMPNHIHAIIALVGAQFIAPLNTAIAPLNTAIVPSQTAASNNPNPVTHPIAVVERPGAMNRAPTALGDVIRGYKARVTVALNRKRDVSGVSIWQRNYYDHIIRDDGELQRIRRYINDNPRRWLMDRENRG